MRLIDFEVTGYDYLTFLALVIIIVAVFYVIIKLASLPGKLAKRNNHPHAFAVNLMGWFGFFVIYPWFQAIIWAYRDSYPVDVRNFPNAPEKTPPDDPTPPGSDTSEKAPQSRPKQLPDATSGDDMNTGQPA
ncbi:DUF3302 domain-containing protein [Roseibium sp. RKSG952]|uniref:DUF3302 domain-containing protein n=1 Tax=Roseibium sp. RKSG952 TaxID=2529384 RepID=UPI0018AD2244|nr:DUF3302 domain-containing protein [Roseibium sp. RKSG952]